jgi:hypothetical protein
MSKERGWSQNAVRPACPVFGTDSQGLIGFGSNRVKSVIPKQPQEAEEFIVTGFARALPPKRIRAVGGDAPHALPAFYYAK